MTAATTIRARDLMQTDLITLQAGDPIRDAIRVFEDEGIHGAPVLDAGGRLVGVLSAFDVAKTSHMDGGRLEDERHEYYLANPLDEGLGDAPWEDEQFYSKEDYSSEVLGGATVADWMNPRAVTVDADAELPVLCKTMTDERIHRVLVVEEGELKGIISSFDIVRYLARAL